MLHKYLLSLILLTACNQLIHAKIINYRFLNTPHNSYSQNVSEEQEALFLCLAEARQAYATWKDHKKATEARAEELKAEAEEVRHPSLKALAEADIFWHSQLLENTEKHLTEITEKCVALQKKIQKIKSK